MQNLFRNALFAWLLLTSFATGNEAFAAALDPNEVAAAARHIANKTLPTYRWFHTHPEISLEEKDTAARLASALRDLGLEVHEKIGGHGIVAILHGSGPGPVVLYRADMDALPVSESTGVPYASANAGVMHACGHDIHMTTAIGTLQLLRDHAAAWRGTILFVGQPAEEVVQGARAMLDDPAWARIIAKVGKPSLSLGLHDTADLPAGDVGLAPGIISANVDSLDITLFGKGGHGAQPHETIDPIVMGAETVLSLQTIVSRRLPPGERAVVTVGQFIGGTKRNIVPPSAVLRLTVRTFTTSARDKILREIERIARGIALAYDAPQPPEITHAEGTEGVDNDRTWTERVRQVFVNNLGAEHVHGVEPSTGGEDFGRFAVALGCPGVFYRLGGVGAQAWAERDSKALPGLHSDKWAPDAEPTLATGIRTMSLALLAGLGAL